MQRSASVPALKKEVKSPADGSRRASHAAGAGETRPGLVHPLLHRHQLTLPPGSSSTSIPTSTEISGHFQRALTSCPAHSMAAFQLRRARPVGSGRGGQTHVAGKPARGHCGCCCTSKATLAVSAPHSGTGSASGARPVLWQHRYPHGDTTHWHRVLVMAPQRWDSPLESGTPHWHCQPWLCSCLQHMPNA